MAGRGDIERTARGNAMRNFLMATAGVVALAMAGQAGAADLATRPYVKAPPPPAPVTNWTGLYIGGHLGYGYGTSTWTFQNVSFFNTVAGDGFVTDPSGWMGGVQAGLNYQVANWVLGVEGTWSAADIHRTLTSFRFPATDTETVSIKNISTVTGRVGYLVTDRWMTYVKGGWAGVRQELSAFSSFGGVTNWNGGTLNRNGYVLGSGTEYMIVPHVTVGVEYNFIDLGTRNYAAFNTGADTTFTSVNDRTRIHSIVGRLNYVFNWGGPAAGRY